MQSTHGNRAVLRAVQRSQTAPTRATGQGAVAVQRGWAKNMWESAKEMVGAETDTEKALEDLKEGLEKAERLCKTGAVMTSDFQAAKRLEEAGEQFGKIGGTLETGLNVAGTVRDVIKFVAAVEEVEGLDIRAEPDKAARAYGRLFAAAGNLGKRLPDGPWSAYFELLGHMEDFFVNMRNKIDPSIRWKSRFDPIEM
jgi:hypothetical protein